MEKLLWILAFLVFFAAFCLFAIPIISKTGFVYADGSKMDDPWYMTISKIAFYVSLAITLPVGIKSIITCNKRPEALKRIAYQVAISVGMAVHMFLAAWLYDTSGRSLALSIIGVIFGLSISGFALQMLVVVTIFGFTRDEE